MDEKQLNIGMYGWESWRRFNKKYVSCNLKKKLRRNDLIFF